MPVVLALLATFSLMLVACADSGGTGTTATTADDTAAEPGVLQAKLDAKRAQWADKADQNTKDIYDAGIEAVEASGVLGSMKKVGDTAPEFSLPNAAGKQVASASLLKDGPIIVVFYRGAWCPYCNLALAAWQARLDEINDLNAQFVAISPQKPDYSLDSKQKNDLAFPVLSDVGNNVADAFGITTQVTPEIIELWEGKIDLEKHNGDDSAELPLPATFLVDTDGTIKFAHADVDYRVRAEPEAVIAELKKLQGK